MIPKEKAKELVNKYKNPFNRSGCIPPTETMFDSTAKQCALITVNEILNSNPHSNPFNTNVYSTMNYWQEVKQEIEQL